MKGGGMYKVSEHVVHRFCGVCLVKDIAPLNPNDPESPIYYVLNPLFGEDSRNTVRVPVANPSSLRSPLTKEEAVRLIETWPNPEQSLYIVDSKRRKTCYQEALSTGDLTLIAPLLAGAMQRKKREGHLNSMDAQFVQRAEPLLYGEVSFALGIPYDEAMTYIHDHSKGIVD